MGGYNPTELAGLLKLSTPPPRPPSREDNPNLATDSFSTSNDDFASTVSLFGDLDSGGGEELDRMERRLRAPRLMACAADSKSEWGSVEELPLVPCEASLWKYHSMPVSSRYRQ
jgi:hypothetical protein